MKHYYFSENNEQFGPFTLDELKCKRIKKSTLIWTDGLEDWVTAVEVDGLKDFAISEPPPLPNKKPIEQDNDVKIQITSPQISNVYIKESDATFVGFLLFIIPFIIILSGGFNFETKESYNQAKIFLSISSFVIRIFVTMWVVGIANRQNRNIIQWGWFAFLLPSISLIVIGLLNKLPLKINIDSSLTIDEKNNILKSKAAELINNHRYNEALSILMKIKEFDVNYPRIDEEIKLCKDKIYTSNKFLIKEKETAPPEKHIISFETNKGKIDVEQNNSYSWPEPGNKVFKNGKVAATGKYRLGFMWYINIENGIITKVSTF